ncbi:MAG: hypothetical protein AAF614_28980 [Chloroflexota bacterium]
MTAGRGDAIGKKRVYTVPVGTNRLARGHNRQDATTDEAGARWVEPFLQVCFAPASPLPTVVG